MPDNQELNTQNHSAQNGDFALPDVSGSEANAPYPSDDAEVYGVLKCYFYTPKRGDIWGAFCFMFNGVTGESMENVFWVTRELVGPSIDVNVHWRALNKIIPQMGNYEKSLGEKLSVLMLEAFPAGSRVELCNGGGSSERLQSIASDIRNSFERATHCFLEFKMAFERMSKQDMVNSGVLVKNNSQSEPASDNMPAEEKSFAGTVITCLPVIDPVYGKAVSELQPDDMLEVKLQGGVGASELIGKFLASTNQEAVFPVEHIETAMVNNSEKTYIFLNINEEVQGIVTVTKDLRLRVLNTGTKKKSSITLNMDNIIFFGVVAAAFVVIALAVRFLLF